MTTKQYTFILGLVFVAVGIMGFIPGFSIHPGAAATELHSDHVLLLGLFPVNTIHNLIHIAFGVWGLVASASAPGAKFYCQANAVIYGVLAVFGLIPGLQTMFGLVPLFGHDIWLHAAIAVTSAYFGFNWRARMTGRTGLSQDRLFKRTGS